MPQVYAKWLVQGTKAQIKEAIEEDGFYIQVYQDENDDNSDTIYSSEAKTTITPVGGGKGYYEVQMIGEASGPVLSPRWRMLAFRPPPMVT